jgi:hypothetical protein
MGSLWRQYVSKAWLRAAAALGVALVASCAAPAAAAPARVAILKRVAHETQFPAGCVGSVYNPVLQRNALAEPHIAVDPKDGRRVVLTWTQDIFSQPAVAQSRDGGRTFSTKVLPLLTKCSGGDTEYATDPWLSFGPEGGVYLAMFASDPTPPIVSQPLSQIFVYRSPDRGATWPAPVVSQPRDGTFWDKPSITADPKRPGTAYVVISRRVPQPGGATGLQYFQKTTDFGQTWSSPSLMYFPGVQRSATASVVRVLPNGTLLDTFSVADNSFNTNSNGSVIHVMSQRSTDQGAHWSNPVEITSWTGLEPKDPDRPDDFQGEYIDANPLPSFTADRAGTSFLVWARIEANRQPVIQLSRSINGGRSWSKPAAIVNTGKQAFLPTIAAAEDGTLGLTWYDTRQDVRGDGKFTTDYRLALSRDGARTWRDQRIAGPFDIHQAAPRIGHPFVGDYFGLAGAPGAFMSAFVVPGPQNRSDIYYAQLRFHPARLHVTVSPRTGVVGGSLRLNITVTASVGGRTVRLAGARVRSGKATALTTVGGRAQLTIAPRSTGRRLVTATLRGFNPGTATLRIRDRPGRPAPGRDNGDDQ